MNAISTVIFDLDGTLVDTLPDIAAAANTLLAQHRLVSHPEDAYRSLVGRGMNSLVDKLVPHFSDTQRKNFYGDLLQQYGRELYARSRLYPGVAALIARLRRDGIQLAIFTNKQHDLALRLVSRFFDIADFRLVLGHRDGAAPKPDTRTTEQLLKELSARPEHCLLVGDTPVDMATAVAVGMASLGVAWGYQPEAALRASGAWGIAHTPDDIDAWLRTSASATDHPLHAAGSSS